ncbi:kirola-like [Rutidosis leptorrhynchoides]|uniref:kirola-like n=1 Tax=Rutidosis leptorrhynchoides TaxID=125765 RepID=UPI003A98D780
MGLTGKKVVKVDIKRNKDVVYELFRYKFFELVNIVPEHFLSVDLQDGEWGAVGSVINVNYLLDGKKQFCKVKIEAVVEANMSITFKILEGDLLSVYISFKAELRVDGNNVNSTVTWTIEYQKVNESVPDPDSIIRAAQKIIKYAETRLDAALNITKDVKIPQLQ